MTADEQGPDTAKVRRWAASLGSDQDAETNVINALCDALDQARSEQLDRGSVSVGVVYVTSCVLIVLAMIEGLR